MNGMERDIIHGKYQTIVLGAMTSEGEVVPAGSSGQLYRCVSRVRDLRIVIVSHSDITYRETTRPSTLPMAKEDTTRVCHFRGLVKLHMLGRPND